MGDIDFAEDERTLWIVNLHERSLVRVDASNLAALSPTVTADVQRFFIASIPGLPTTTTGVMRPFGLKLHEGRGYLGVVDSAELSQDRNDARAFVLSFDASNPAAGFTNEVEFNLNYVREAEHTSLVHDWQAWTRDENDLPWVTGSRRYAQAMVADIDFDSQGDMTIGLGDRFGLQTGYIQLAIQRDYAGTARMTGSASGDILRACRVGSAFVLEGRPGCEVNDLALGDPFGPRFPLATDGPEGNGEFYSEDFHENTHSEVGTNGALAIVPGADRVLFPVADPLHRHDFLNANAIWSQGIHGYSTRTGARLQRYLIVPGPVIETFGKGTGIGDVEMICAPAPIEIGGIVFYDENSDHRQTAGDRGLPGVAVELLLDGATVASTMTNAAGRYTFRDEIVSGGFLPLRSGYRVRVHLPQPALDGYAPSQANAAGNDAMDSDGRTTLDAGFSAVDVTTGKAGHRGSHSRLRLRPLATRRSRTGCREAPRTLRCVPIKYIGSKRVLIPAIVDQVRALTPRGTVLDLFSGTSRVGHALKAKGYRVIANDYLACCHANAMAYVQADRDDWQTRATQLIAELNGMEGQPGWFTETFGIQSRFVHPRNGARVDAMREAIASWTLEPELEAILLVSLMEATDRVDSTTGVQMAYLKSWSQRSRNDLTLRMPSLLNRAVAGKAEAHNLDARAAARQLEADVAYLDPPYNQHSYLGNYHVWESLVRWDKPDVYGIACKRDECKTKKSPFNSKRAYVDAWRALIASVNATHLLVSFSDEGFITREQMVEVLSTRGRRRDACDRALALRRGAHWHSQSGRRAGWHRRAPEEHRVSVCCS